MATVYIFNQDTNSIERYELGDHESMPYITNHTLTVREFRGSSCSNVMWTSKAVMQAWNTTRDAYGRPIPLGYAFKRIWEGGHAAQSQHYAGASFDVGQRLSNAERSRLRNIAINTRVWAYVEPAYLTPTWVHFDRRKSPPACASGGYPLLRQGSKSNYVFTLQDAITTLGYGGGGLDGIFGAGTRAAVIRFQRENALAADGVVGCATWTKLAKQTLGIGATGGTVHACWK